MCARMCVRVCVHVCACVCVCVWGGGGVCMCVCDALRIAIAFRKGVGKFIKKNSFVLCTLLFSPYWLLLI